MPVRTDHPPQGLGTVFDKMKRLLFYLPIFACSFLTGCGSDKETPETGSGSAGETGKQYALLDLYDQNGIRGIVYSVSEDGRHGSIVSLEEGADYWMQKNFFPVQTVSPSDGLLNFRIVQDIPGWEEILPAFKWCNDLNEGGETIWYLPARNELKLLWQTYDSNREAFNEALTEHGGTAITDERYWSSTESEQNGKYWADTVHFTTGQIDGYVRDWAHFHIRAIHKF